MKRKTLSATLLIVGLSVAAIVVIYRASEPPLASFPTRPGSYSANGWRYDYTIAAAGTRSERRSGRLYRDGAEIIGTPGEIRDTLLGRFACFGPAGRFAYNSGWLNTMTYDRPVFGPDGSVLAEPQGYLATARRAGCRTVTRRSSRGQSGFDAPV